MDRPRKKRRTADLDDDEVGVVDGRDEEEPSPMAVILEPPPRPLAAGEGAVAAAAAAIEAEANEPDPVAEHRPGGAYTFDDGDGNFYAHAYNLRQAIDLLEDVGDQRPIYGLDVSRFKDQPSHRDDEIDREDARSFRRFVSLLGQKEGSRTVRNITLSIRWWGLEDEDIESLFGEVLPAHRTLEGITIILFELPTRFLRMLVESIPTERLSLLSRLRLYGGTSQPTLQAQNVRAIVDMLDRNAAIPSLHVMFSLEADQGKLICQALPRNTNLLYLELNLKDVYADTLEGVAESTLRQLHVSGPFSAAAASSFARQLRTNETLWNLQLTDQDNGIRDSQALHHFARTYNHTLRTLETVQASGDSIVWPGIMLRRHYEEYMRRNARIRDALQQLQDPDPHNATLPKRLLPRTLGLVSEVPTVLYRILRMGYVNAVSKLISPTAEADP